METRFDELSGVPDTVANGLSRRGEFHDQAHHGLGYLLGERLHRAHRRGRLSRPALRRLFEARALSPKGAFRRYLRYARQLG